MDEFSLKSRQIIRENMKTLLLIISILFWVISILGSALGVLTLISTLKSATGAPQEAAGAAMAISFAVIPYCVARAVSEIQSNFKKKDI
jgi:hypothetical protein